ncbi:MAG: hypothetical protein EA343_20655 [Nodularia sp. (in: Bacteria)]|nr:MAG: hypothetical protein EA343_20655 [Nodularia sp. (in: cyanobacteria)]
MTKHSSFYLTIFTFVFIVIFKNPATAGKIPDFKNRLYKPVQSSLCKSNIRVRHGKFQGKGREGGKCLFQIEEILKFKKSDNAQLSYYVVTAYSTGGGSYYEVHGYIYTSQAKLIHYFTPAKIINGNLLGGQQLEGILVKDNYIYTFTSNPRYGRRIECSDTLPVSQQGFQFDKVIAKKYTINNGKIQYLNSKILPTTHTLCANSKYFKEF